MNELVEYFKAKGMKNPYRSIELIKESISFNKLNLSELIVFTEAASGDFIYTPIIAAMAGARKVYAITNTSFYGTKEEIKNDTLLFAKLCGVENSIEIVYDKKYISQADIITNLGFVRPIDKKTIDMMKSNSVIAYMCEAWEVREGDVDVNYCKVNDIPVIGTNENYPGLDVFNYSGLLILKMIFDAGLEIYKNKIVIVSNDNFGKVIFDTLKKLTGDVILVNDLIEINRSYLSNVDIVIIADYISNKCHIGNSNCGITAKELKALSNKVTVIQFAGIVDIGELGNNGIEIYPEHQVGSFRMGKTLAYIGPKPIIDLHCSGLKVGEIIYNQKNFNKFYDDSIMNLCQFIR